MKIVEKSGNIMVEYYYDGYGKIVYSTNNDLSKINPYKYRGYYYDIESGWYYLNNRYYDNKTCRFVTMDDIEYLGESGTIHSYNLFIYCEGNPVRYIDPIGHASISKDKYFVADTEAHSALSDGSLIELYILEFNLFFLFGITSRNIINAIYYNYYSDGVSDLTLDSYRYGSISRWERLDYVKSQTKEETYNINAWRYFSEYNTHMYAWFLLGWAYKKDMGVFSDFADSASKADVDSDDWEHGKNEWRNLIYAFIGVLGL